MSGTPGENLRQLATVIWIEMHHHDEGGARPLRKRFEETLQRCHAARGGSDRHNGWFCWASLWLASALALCIIVRHAHHPFTPLTRKFQIMTATCVSEKLQSALGIAIPFVSDNHRHKISSSW
jgi:hypothetical protein